MSRSANTTNTPLLTRDAQAGGVCRAAVPPDLLQAMPQDRRNAAWPHRVRSFHQFDPGWTARARRGAGLSRSIDHRADGQRLLQSGARPGPDPDRRSRHSRCCRRARPSCPAPNVVTSVAPYTSRQSDVGPPDLPPTTIPSIVPTPNLVAPQAPSLSTSSGLWRTAPARRLGRLRRPAGAPLTRSPAWRGGSARSRLPSRQSVRPRRAAPPARKAPIS